MRTILAFGALLAFLDAAVAQEKEEGTDARKAEIVNKLNTQRVTVDFTDTPLDDVINYFREITSINFFVDPELRTKLTDDQLKVTIKLKDILLKSALKLVLSAKELTAVYKDGLLMIQHKDKAAAASVSLQIYDVRDLLLKIEDFPGPKMELSATKSGLDTGIMALPDTQERITEDFIVEMVKANTGDRSWEENANVSVSLANGLLVVTQTRKVHEEIMRLVSLLRQFK